MTSTQYLGADSPENWNETAIKSIRYSGSIVEGIDGGSEFTQCKIYPQTTILGMVPGGTSTTSSLSSSQLIPREALDETVLRVQEDLDTIV